MMSNETMPEKIWMSEEGIKKNSWTAIRYPDTNIEYTRSDTIPDMTELQRQNAVLKKFARSIINEKCFGYDGEIDGASVQDQAANCGLITPNTVTREMIDGWEKNENYPEGDFEVGDTVFDFSDWMSDDTAKMPIPSRAQVAREFMEAVDCEFYEGKSSTRGDAILQVLEEWDRQCQ